MPIAVKDYKWEESNTTLFITVPLKGVKPHKIDIFSTEDYVKVILVYYRSQPGTDWHRCREIYYWRVDSLS